MMLLLVLGLPFLKVHYRKDKAKELFVNSNYNNQWKNNDRISMET